jgi:hypothetical protein
MKLGGVPTVQVTDKAGTDVTASKKANYQIYYATNATNSSNYTGATYTSSYSGATMIQLTNIASIQPGEKATITFDYVVDETPASVELNPEKI